MTSFRPVEGGLATSEQDVFTAFTAIAEVRGRRVLEIGGCLPREIVQRAEPAAWISLDPRNPDLGNDPNFRSLRGNAQLVPFPDESFDFVFSSNAFHHISALDSALFEMRRVLRPGGLVFANFGPIWSAPDGSHVEDVTFGGCSYNFWEQRFIPDWYHLVYSCRELYDILITALGGGLAQALVEYVYLSSWINRLEFDDYERLLHRSGLEVETFEGTSTVDYVSPLPPYNNPLQWKVDQWMSRKGQRLERYRYRDLKLVLHRRGTARLTARR
jgi:SAM-dependent methyltransferase